jgi:hypothetical protein
MECIMATIQGLKILDSWPDSEIKTRLLILREALNTENKYPYDFDGIPVEVIKGLKNTIIQADPLGNPISLFEWAVCFESMKTHLAEDYFECQGNEIRVSTVWLGLNHGWDGSVQIFETMTFGIEDNEELKYYQKRYETIQQAEEGHKEACDLVTNYLQINKKKQN